MHAETSPSLALRPHSVDALGAAADPLGIDGVRMTYARNEEIFGEAEPAVCVYRVLKGVVRTYRILTDGRRQIAEFYLPGDVFGLESGASHRTSAEAVSDCEVVAIRRTHLADRALNNSATAQKLLALSLHCLKRSEEHMLVLGRKNASERVAWFLMDMSERIPAPHRLDLPVSRQDMADFLGLTIETVSRTMTQLCDDEMVELPSCRQVVFKNHRALQDMAA